MTSAALSPQRHTQLLTKNDFWVLRIVIRSCTVIY
nr:MAG TPA: hypothetical protein [Caudoviricetes sp.]